MQTNTTFNLNGLTRALIAFLFPVFMCGGLASGFYFYDTVRTVISRVTLPDYTLEMTKIARPLAEALPTLQAPNIAAGDRLNILLMGIDRRPEEKCPCRSDTMIVATYDPRSKTAGMLSIPRDLYVPIPALNAGENRINTALFYGDLVKYPGGGPALAKKTVEYNLGIPVHYYIIIDFVGFQKIVDTLGGIDIDVPNALRDEEYPTMDYRTMIVEIPAGRVHMNGDLALKYARIRHGSSDFDRSRRQMQVILGIRDKALRIDALSRLPQLISQLKDTVQTDIPPQSVLLLAPQARDIKSTDIKTRSIDQSMTDEIVLASGADVLWPKRPRIAALVKELFPEYLATGLTSPEQIKQENARIAVLNGTTRGGIAYTAANYLRAKGLNVVLVDNADRTDYANSVLIDYVEKPATLAALAKWMNIRENRISSASDTSDTVDIRVIIGADWTPPSN
ncbi:MAG TPA: LCP family protein [Anaerolineae bacterium]